MSKILLNLPDDVHKKIKEQALIGGRSVTKEIIYTFQRLYDMTPLDPISALKAKTGEGLSEGTTLKTKIPKSKTPEEIEEEQISHFKKLAKNILGHEIKDEDFNEYAILEPDMTYYNFAEVQEGRFLRFAYTMSEEKQKEYLEEWKHYE